MKELGPNEGMNALRHPECRFCDEYEQLIRGVAAERDQLKKQVADQEARYRTAYEELDAAVRQWENATTSRLKLLAAPARQPESSDLRLKPDAALFEARKSISSALQGSGGGG